MHQLSWSEARRSPAPKSKGLSLSECGNSNILILCTEFESCLLYFLLTQLSSSHILGFVVNEEFVFGLWKQGLWINWESYGLCDLQFSFAHRFTNINKNYICIWQSGPSVIGESLTKYCIYKNTVLRFLTSLKFFPKQISPCEGHTKPRFVSTTFLSWRILELHQGKK